MKKIDFSAKKKSLSYTEIRNCPLCNSSQSKSILRFDSFQFLTDLHEHSKTVDIDIHICDQCTTLFNNPVYTDEGFKNLFAEMGHSYGMSEGRSNEQIDYLQKYWNFEQNFQRFRSWCYRGELLSHFPNKLEKDGVDIDYPSIQIAKKGIQKQVFLPRSGKILYRKNTI